METKDRKAEILPAFSQPLSHTIRLLDTQKLIFKVNFTLDKSDFQTKLVFYL